MTEPLLELSGVSMKYGALRPLRLERLSLSAGEHVAILGLDQPAAEVLINLLTGASVPDAGDIRLFGRLTTAITDSTDWLATVDRFGIVTERAALLESMTVIQNLSVPFSLEIEPPPPDIVRQASGLAAEAGLHASLWERRVGDLDASARMRVRLGRALAFNPAVLLLEHPSATLPRADIAHFADDVRGIVRGRNVAALTITADSEFAKSASARMLAHEPATGKLRAR